MTELVIGGRRVVLPKSLSFTLIEENAEITSSGEYSWDISASLKNKINAMIFKNIYRLNVSTVDVTSDATLIIDNRVRKGKIILLNNTDSEVKFQFVCGNAELNYIAQNDTKIGDYDWGKEATAIDFTRARKSLNYPGYGLFSGYQNNFVCTPVALENETVNAYTISPDTSNPPLEINGVGTIIMQPYLLYYINKLPEVLGYSLKYNALNEDDLAKKIFIVNSVNSLKYSDALPDMTMSEFITAIENFFNVSFTVHPTDKTISINSVQSSISSRKIVKPIVFDAYERNMDEDSESLKLNFTKISYDLGSSNFFKWNCLSSYILSNYKQVSYANLAAIKDWILHNLQDSGAPSNIIFHDNEKNDDYIHVTDVQPATNLFTVPITVSGDSDTLRRIKLVNKFSSVGDDSDKELVLKIVPAEIIKSYQSVNVNSGTAKAYFQLPKSENTYYIPTTSTLISSVEGSETTVPRQNKLVVAIYTGCLKTYFENNVGYVFDIPTLYPFSHVDSTPEFTGSNDLQKLLGLQTWADAFKLVATNTLKLKGATGILARYHQSSILDTSKGYKFTMIENSNTNASSLFLVNNRYYMPISLEHEVNISGFGKKVTGKFYAFK